MLSFDQFKTSLQRKNLCFTNKFYRGSGPLIGFFPFRSVSQPSQAHGSVSASPVGPLILVQLYGKRHICLIQTMPLRAPDKRMLSLN